MSKSKSPFSIALADFAEVVEENAVERVKEIGYGAIEGLVAIAPIDTSNYVSNMNVSWGVPDTSAESFKHLGKAVAFAVGSGIIDKGSDKSLTDLHFTNTVEYAGALEDGWSSQAPEGVFDPVFWGLAQEFAN